MKSRNDINKIKHDYRTRLKGIRDRLAQEQYTRFNQSIMKNLRNVAEFQSAKRIFSYISNGSEADTHALIRARIDDLEVLAVPRINHSTMLAVEFPGWEKVRTGPMGILAPASNEACPASYDVVITPGLGFTRQGVRMGYGRGYYDRWFAEHRSGMKIALCYDIQIVESLPHDDHDIPVDLIVTEQEIIRVD